MMIRRHSGNKCIQLYQEENEITQTNVLCKNSEGLKK